MKPTTFERRRQRVLDAAERLFTELDYARVHMDAVADAAEIAKPTLYRYFPTKEALFLAALDGTLSGTVAEVARLRAGSGSAEARLRRAIALVSERIGGLAPALRAVEDEGPDPNNRSRKALRRGFGALRDEITALLDEGVRHGEFDVEDTTLAALAIVGALRMTASLGRGTERSAKDVADLFIGGLGRRSASRGASLRPGKVAEMGAAS